MLFNVANALVDYFHADILSAEIVIVKTSNLLVFVFLYIFIVFLTAYVGRILQLQASETSGNIKVLQKTIYRMCAAGILIILLCQVFNLVHAFSNQSRAFWMNSAAIHLLIFQAAFILLFIMVLSNRGLLHLMEFRVFVLITVIPLSAPMLQLMFYKFAVFSGLTFIAVLLCVIVYLWEVSDKTTHIKDVCLTAANIDMLSEKFADYLHKTGVGRRMTTTVRLKLEETVLRMKERFGEEAKVDFFMVNVFVILYCNQPDYAADGDDHPGRQSGNAGQREAGWRLITPQNPSLRLSVNNWKLSEPLKFQRFFYIRQTKCQFITFDRNRHRSLTKRGEY